MLEQQKGIHIWIYTREKRHEKMSYCLLKYRRAIVPQFIYVLIWKKSFRLFTEIPSCHEQKILIHQYGCFFRWIKEVFVTRNILWNMIFILDVHVIYVHYFYLLLEFINKISIMIIFFQSCINNTIHKCETYLQYSSYAYQYFIIF